LKAAAVFFPSAACFSFSLGNYSAGRQGISLQTLVDRFSVAFCRPADWTRAELSGLQSYESVFSCISQLSFVHAPPTAEQDVNQRYRCSSNQQQVNHSTGDLSDQAQDP